MGEGGGRRRRNRPKLTRINVVKVELVPCGIYKGLVADWRGWKSVISRRWWEQGFELL